MMCIRTGAKRSLEDLDERSSQLEGTPLYYSAACGLRSLTEQFFAIHPNDLNPQESFDRVRLRGVVNNDHLDVARLLPEHGADASNRRPSWTLLHYASHGGSSDVVQLLLEYQADVDRRGHDDQTPLHLASETGELTAMRPLLEYGADVDSVMVHSWTPVHRASGGGETLKLFVY
ncbi:ankyrin repeat-containing domain protein [Russula compacta]|nr:ankyrin repeat-containing domain protein [Russula compacta]